jgi:hypothetical protein
MTGDTAGPPLDALVMALHRATLEMIRYRGWDPSSMRVDSPCGSRRPRPWPPLRRPAGHAGNHAGHPRPVDGSHPQGRAARTVEERRIVNLARGPSR